MRSTIDEDKYEERNISIMNILHKCLLIKSIKVDENELRNRFPK